MKTLAIVIGMVYRQGRVLMLKREPGKRHAPGRWEPVGGFLRRHEAAERAVLRQANERAGLDARIVRSGGAFECEDGGAWWIVKPFLLEPVSSDARVELRNGHVDFKWVTPRELLTLDCVDGIAEDMQALGLVI
jgi:8-oxo-dGTP diphosphatase